MLKRKRKRRKGKKRKEEQNIFGINSKKRHAKTKATVRNQKKNRAFLSQSFTWKIASEDHWKSLILERATSSFSPETHHLQSSRASFGCLKSLKASFSPHFLSLSVPSRPRILLQILQRMNHYHFLLLCLLLLGKHFPSSDASLHFPPSQLYPS